uniref:Uncharacterized protein n=1 Tax=Leersia perrieri TaxID=77586 RepID=A0A0D9XZ96_9ORYZ
MRRKQTPQALSVPGFPRAAAGLSSRSPIDLPLPAFSRSTTTPPAQPHVVEGLDHVKDVAGADVDPEGYAESARGLLGTLVLTSCIKCGSEHQIFDEEAHEGEEFFGEKFEF